VLNFELSFMAVMPIKTFARKTLAGFMALWLSGFVFLFCAIAMYGEPADAASASMDGMSEHCKKAMAAKSENTTADVVERAEENVDCCAFFPAVFDRNRKLERTEKAQLVSTQPTTVRLDVAPTVNHRPNFVRFTPYIPDRQYTFIKNRVFRI
jgi:hypothetical protein